MNVSCWLRLDIADERITVEVSSRSIRHCSSGPYMPKMDPVVNAVSILADPSIGSKTTM